jgi:hypothetical protein
MATAESTIALAAIKPASPAKSLLAPFGDIEL